MPTIRMEQVAKSYKSRERRVAAIVNADLTIEQGEFLFVVGSRGAGKSTLLRLLSGELKPDRGAVYMDGVNLSKLRRGERARGAVGYVPQESALIRSETVFENLSYRGWLDEFRSRVAGEAGPNEQLLNKALSLVGMPGSGKRPARELTAAEGRRVEVARAILHSPNVLLLDEVTDRMDDDTVWDLMHLFTELNNRGTTIVMATNASRIVNAMRKRLVTLADGQIVGDIPRGKYGQIGRPGAVNNAAYLRLSR